MELVVIGVAAVLAAGLTLFSGFGLGTLLLPVFALFFPAPLAVAATAVVHLANNLFKCGLMAKQANGQVVARFGVPAALAAMAGAGVLAWFDHLPPLATYGLAGTVHEVTAVKILIGLLIMAFVGLEHSPRIQALVLPQRYLPLGGLLSGFFGGLSGHQGALRSAFLLKAGLDRDAFVATGVVCAVLIDLSRLMVYGTGGLAAHFNASAEVLLPVTVGILGAFTGVLIDQRLLRKVTLHTVQRVVTALMVWIGAGLITGLV